MKAAIKTWKKNEEHEEDAEEYAERIEREKYDERLRERQKERDLYQKEKTELKAEIKNLIAKYNRLVKINNYYFYGCIVLMIMLLIAVANIKFNWFAI